PSDSLAQAGRASGSAQGRVEQREGRSSGSARGRVDTRRDDRYERRDDRDRRDYDRRYDDDRDRNGKGPKFCRNGSGHPVHGRAWCRDKGWDRDREWDRRDRDRRWDRVDWGDVIFGRGDRRGDRFGSNVLLDLLGDRVYGRLDNHRRSRGYDSRLDGRWDSYGSGHVLQVFAGGVPIAQLIDANRDGRAEMVLLNRR
ncbi:MAG: hypothetical protein ACREKM_03665, partial [Longimicrobiales bacterium]